MELLFNLAWLAVAISIWGLWLADRRGARKKCVLGSIAVQIIAMAMLTAILLPVISITDDLHSCQLPAEVKRSVLQSDRQVSPAGAPGILPFALTLLELCMNLLRPRSLGVLVCEQPAPRNTKGYLDCLWCRPPPAAIA